MRNTIRNGLALMFALQAFDCRETTGVVVSEEGYVALGEKRRRDCRRG